MTPGLRRLYAPRPVTVRVGPDGTPLAVDGVAVDSVREAWQVEDRWWTPEQLRRRYFELALADGRVLVVFHCVLTKSWYRQRA